MIKTAIGLYLIYISQILLGIAVFIFIFNYSDKLQSGDITLSGDINKTISVSVEPTCTEIIEIKKAVK